MKKEIADKIANEEAVDLIAKTLARWWEVAVSSLPNLIVSLVILVLFFFLAKIAQKISRKVIFKISRNSAVSSILSKMTFALFLIGGVFVALSILKLDKTVASLLAGAGVVGLALGFAFQEIAANVLSGFFIAFQKPFEPGDIVEVSGYAGEIESINIRTTNIRTYQGLLVIVPNKTMFTDILINYTETPDRRFDLECGISYGENLEKVKEVSEKALSEMEHRDKTKDVQLYFKDFGGSSINFVVQIWMSYATQKIFLKTRDEAIMKLKKAFDENGITIPYPIRTLDFGIKAGEKLSQMLEVKDND